MMPPEVEEAIRSKSNRTGGECTRSTNAQSHESRYVSVRCIRMPGKTDVWQNARTSRIVRTYRSRPFVEEQYRKSVNKQPR